MNTEIGENQVRSTDKSALTQLIVQSVRDISERLIRPNIRQWDEDQHFPANLFRQLGEQGLMGMLVPVEYGGAGLGYEEYVASIVELSRVDGSVGLSMAAHNSLCTNHILLFGNEEQKQTYLPRLATGEWLGAWGLTEPNTGSDAGNMRTTAVKDGRGDGPCYWVLNGAKNFITHGISGNVAVVIARTGEPNTPRNATAFVVERGTPGFSGGRKEDKLGMRASETAEMLFQDCRISDSQRLGEVGDGFIQSLKVLDGGRISIAALSLGIAHGAYDAALAYAQEREQFGQPIVNFHGISFKLADMATDIEASKLLTYQAATLKDEGKPVTKESAMAKLFASETAVRVANEAVLVAEGGAARLGGLDYSILTLLAEGVAEDQASLIEAISTSRSSTLPAIARLLEGGLIERAGDPGDRRRKPLAVTAAGRARIAALAGAVARYEKAFLAPLDAGAARRLHALLGRLAEPIASP